MTMSFDDAGRMRFARIMGMPGSITDELKGIVAPKAARSRAGGTPAS
jgi:hypothetical protein